MNRGKSPFTFLPVAALCSTLIGAAPCRAQSTLDMPLDTGQTPKVNASVPAQSAPTRNAAALASRGSANYGSGMRQAVTAAPQVLAQLGTVTAASVTIHAGIDANSRVLSVVPKDTNLAVVADGGQYWGVLMVNNTMGWVPKAALQMIDYRTTIDVPATPEASPATTSGGQADMGGQTSPSPLDARTTGLLREAFSYLGVPYVWAGNTRNGLDCSGFLCNVFSGALGIHLPRHSGDQARVGLAVTGDDLRPGDRLYFDMGNRGEISHCGIYIGNGLFIHASTNHGRVAVDSVYQNNYRRALVCARRS